MFDDTDNDNLFVFSERPDGTQHVLSPNIFSPDTVVTDETLLLMGVNVYRKVTVLINNVIAEPEIAGVSLKISPVVGAPADVVQTVTIKLVSGEPFEVRFSAFPFPCMEHEVGIMLLELNHLF